ncbi:SUMF1/EgtB/PvdO family nonheme iron enzyme [Polyangium sp. y55x31]|uniref:formylglycine-generating enzyme family protein n=1 Tax=Polyangium sp. y55x31 TaxID=3042688 RepID=UPI0024826431|nr:SUMF1/EgtB/PvdO family nonheme iron enzyme [Polyangium sp. y55x31]MDI1480638.1 SUMF1/EgtB/PvdO family nonheme iron enzyme [Polyangium sp. y55x31]
MIRRRIALWLPSLAVLVGCAKQPSGGSGSDDAGATPPAIDGGGVPDAATATTAAAEETGPCAGKAEGALACDGESVVRCAGTGRAPEAVKTCLDIERCEAGACAPACPEGEVYVPATGPAGFKMGKNLSAFGFGNRKSGNHGKGRADLPHKVVLTKPFCMDQTEVTAGAMKKCVQEKGCKAPQRTDRWVTYPDKPDYPVNLVDYPMSKYYCEQYGKSLPTEAQWEWAATGGDGRSWPWGEEEPTCEHADFTQAILISPGGDSGCHGGGPSKVGTHRKGDRIWPSGPIHDLAGNVWEWVLDSYVPYSGKDEVDPVHLRPSIGNYVVRGGGWNRSGRGILAAFRGGAIVSYKVPGLGFRCVRNAKEREASASPR